MQVGGEQLVDFIGVSIRKHQCWLCKWQIPLPSWPPVLTSDLKLQSWGVYVVTIHTCGVCSRMWCCDVKAVENPLWPSVQSGQIITAQYAAACRRTIQAIGEPSMLAGLMAARTAGSSNSGSGSSNGNDSIDSGSSGGCGIDNGSGSDGVASHSESQARALLDELYDRSEQRMAACGALPMVQDFMYCWLERKGDSKEHTYG